MILMFSVYYSPFIGTPGRTGQRRCRREVQGCKRSFNRIGHIHALQFDFFFPIVLQWACSNMLLPYLLLMKHKEEYCHFQVPSKLVSQCFQEHVTLWNIPPLQINVSIQSLNSFFIMFANEIHVSCTNDLCALWHLICVWSVVVGSDA